ncbi:Transcriptional regulator of ribosomal biogenesis proteins [Scheffersomyces spartinae]|uniref:Transcriptional regulator of ribosomal biogenesis proteins n=1 Tax=Scheffersomyces spartinae TaxID=45513 RepID=A0A9P7VC34_9ASCO|nr:Transcriptional regulator of ribosomal biogenesis proteins [Scheffersomyces spartinae]KAG7195229.1 Transcriptional regulator of ribosomal biogenesis proteins [Scheffersomyces spartinae]
MSVSGSSSHGTRPVSHRNSFRRESVVMRDVSTSWGSITIGSWLKDEVMMYNTTNNAAAFNNNNGSNTQSSNSNYHYPLINPRRGSFRFTGNNNGNGYSNPNNMNNSNVNNGNNNNHNANMNYMHSMSPPIQHSAASYLPDLEADYCKDYSCCGQLLPTLHDLLRHYEEAHISPSPPSDHSAHPQIHNPHHYDPNQSIPGSLHHASHGTGAHDIPHDPDAMDEDMIHHALSHHHQLQSPHLFARARAQLSTNNSIMETVSTNDVFLNNTHNRHHNPHHMSNTSMHHPATSGASLDLALATTSSNLQSHHFNIQPQTIQQQSVHSSRPGNSNTKTSAGSGRVNQEIQQEQQNQQLARLQQQLLQQLHQSHHQQQLQLQLQLSQLQQNQQSRHQLPQTPNHQLQQSHQQAQAHQSHQQQQRNSSLSQVRQSNQRQQQRVSQGSGNGSSFSRSQKNGGNEDEDAMYIDDPARHLYIMENSENKPFRCPVIGCDKMYKNQNGLKYHRLHGHQNQMLQENPDGTISVIDPELNTPYLDGASMEKDKPYRCEVCGKRYKNLNGLKYHRGHTTH